MPDERDQEPPASTWLPPGSRPSRDDPAAPRPEPKAPEEPLSATDKAVGGGCLVMIVVFGWWLAGLVGIIGDEDKITSQADPAPVAEQREPLAEDGDIPARSDLQVSDAQVRNRVRSRLDFPGSSRYRIGRVEVSAGDVTIYTGIGADADGKMASNGVCAEVWGLQGESAPEGVERVQVYGRDVAGDAAFLQDC